MDKFIIDGGRPLRGSVRVNGSKNAALPILIATLLTDEPCSIGNVPDLRDIRTTLRLLETMGKRVSRRGKEVRVEGGRRLSRKAPYDLVKQMRASVLVLGPLLARFGEARAALPGGCAIGLRPIDIHIKGFEDLGAASRTEQGDVVLEGSLRPGRAVLRFPSVGATENLMMAAAAIEGETIIENAAREPEIADLGGFLRVLGARVSGAGGSRVRVRGARRLHGARYRVCADRIETGTFLLAAATAGGSVLLKGAEPEHLAALIKGLVRSGAAVRESGRPAHPIEGQAQAGLDPYGAPSRVSDRPPGPLDELYVPGPGLEPGPGGHLREALPPRRRAQAHGGPGGRGRPGRRHRGGRGAFRGSGDGLRHPGRSRSHRGRPRGPRADRGPARLPYRPGL